MRLSELGEFRLIDAIRARTGTAAGVHRGIGDDAAELELPPGHRLLTSTDLLLEDVHFRLDWTSAFDLGRKAVAVNLSDIAAMGGAPRFLYVGLACSGATEVAQLEAFVDGVLTEAAEHGAVLVGGDTCRSPGPWIISVTIEGTAPAGKAVGRDGARPGDAVLVSGTLGDSALALALWQQGLTPEPWLAERHTRPVPRVALGRGLAEAGLATAMIDLSDGIASDLEHILQASGVGAEIRRAAVPLSPPFRARLERQPELFDLALGGGEDYELLCTVPAARVAEALAVGERCGVPLSAVGAITPAGTGLQLRDDAGTVRPLRVRGYDHFCR
ncbi:MAG: thiamine-phosphate kinase [Deltaproteobacteria bacterium]|nr:MAG: thiamine-phosphate kinase [Deltaproteobacteria bacterium]